ncbi:MAG: hypothetical protein QOH08_185, partial [Chloroflexota bacterium]|nr:hypothetical protein [Chloroflexota bacterium]
IPAAARLVPVAFDDITRLWLVDLGGGAAPVNVAVWRAPRAGLASETVSSTPGARSAVLGAWGPSGNAAIYAYDVASGRTALLYEDPDADQPAVLAPTITPDGARYAFQTAIDVRAGATGGGPTARVIAHPEPQNVFGVWHPVAWSSDGALLAISRSSEGDSELAIVPGQGGSARVVGKGTLAAWRPDAPLLAVAAGVTAFGGRGLMYTFDAVTGVKIDLDTPTTWSLAALRWDPSSDTLAFIAADGIGGRREIWTRARTAPATKVSALTRNALDVWWSPAGSALYALVPRDDAIAQLGVANLEVLRVGGSGERIATVCRGDPRAPCP